MKTIAMFAVVSLMALSLPAESSAELARKNGCSGCHALDEKTIGPAIQDIAAHYANDPDAVQKLFEKVKNGGGGPWHGVWGQVPMPPNPQVKDEDLREILTWMLQQKPQP